MKHPKSYDSTPETRKRMSQIALKGGKAETILGKALWHRGYRYRRNYKMLPGTPDIAILKHRIAVFVDGEFWHGKNWENRKTKLKSNKEYWLEKIDENINRDNRNDVLLNHLGWVAVHFWEKDVLKNIEGCIRAIEEIILENRMLIVDDSDCVDQTEL